MSEYIIRVDENDERWKYVRQQYTHFFGYPITEEIVRCKDCMYRNPNPSEAIWEEDGKIVRGFPAKSAYLCSLINRCVDISGFCKWGQRKQDDE